MVGPVKKASLAFDAQGKSKGTAEIIFVRRNDAVLAMRKYDNVPLDGRPMKIEMTTRAPILQMAAGSSAGPASGGRLGRPNRDAKGQQSRGGRGGSRGGRGGRRGGANGPNRREKRPNKTADELDAEMDTYMASVP